jgi:23S rRNA (pseudouridine1915-N3)-methyltransferase
VPIKIITVTSNQKKSPAIVYANEWLDKLSRYTSVECANIKPNPLNAKDPQQAKAEESKRVLEKISGGSTYTICLDERGRDIDSDGMADILQKASDSGCTSLAFLIGGPWGHDPAVRSAASETIRLSRCVLNHAVAHVVLSEQLYRAWTIVKGEKYHH